MVSKIFWKKEVNELHTGAYKNNFVLSEWKIRLIKIFSPSLLGKTNNVSSRPIETIDYSMDGAKAHGVYLQSHQKEFFYWDAKAIWALFSIWKYIKQFFFLVLTKQMEALVTSAEECLWFFLRQWHQKELLRSASNSLSISKLGPQVGVHNL